ncbi:hypothetical protein COO60DRAFT_1643321 [Scenedesmus sp. NREL 46B-D3]|nr:hypothetical protein COO60DRAFT_1643321 [Scenedesmus sp. NREL 46B-D3]
MGLLLVARGLLLASRLIAGTFRTAAGGVPGQLTGTVEAAAQGEAGAETEAEAPAVKAAEAALEAEQGPGAAAAATSKAEEAEADSAAGAEAAAAAAAAAAAGLTMLALNAPGASCDVPGFSLNSAVRGWSIRVAWLGTVLPAIEMLGGPGSEQACAAARQQLLQLQGRLQQGLQEAVGVLDSSTGICAGVLPAAVAAALPAVAQQMAALGEALCDQFPLPHCCNNPCCVELRGVSELRLVGGKGCVCGRCRTARYCSRQCQLQHLKAHKPVCKRIAGQPGKAAAAESSPAG